MMEMLLLLVFYSLQINKSNGNKAGLDFLKMFKSNRDIGVFVIF